MGKSILHLRRHRRGPGGLRGGQAEPEPAAGAQRDLRRDVRLLPEGPEGAPHRQARGLAYHRGGRDPNR